MVQNGYSEYDSVKVKLRVGDDSMRDEIQLYMHEIDDLIDNRLRAKLGSNNIYGTPLVLPLTFNTIPPVPLELKAIANDLVVAKIRLQNSEKPLLWDSAVKILDNYLERVYGYTRDVGFQPIRTFTVTPTSGIIGATITLAGTNFQPTKEISFSSTIITATVPATVVSTVKGVFSATFTIPAGTTDGTYEIKAFDKFGGLVIRFSVTS